MPNPQPTTSQSYVRTRSRTRIETELSSAPKASSADRPWSGLTVQLHDWSGSGSAVSPAVDHDILAMRVTGCARLEQRRLGTVHSETVVPGNLGLHPRGVESRWSWDRPGAIVLARVPQDILREAAEASLRRSPDWVELQNCFGARDPFVEPVMKLFAHEIQQPAHPAQELIADSLSCALAFHLVNRFNTRTPIAAPAPAGLKPRALTRVLDYLHNHPSDSITLDQLAAIAAVSRFHFARMFKRSMGASPMAYLERIRLSRATELIQARTLTLSEIAAGIGFADQAHFTRRFRRMMGCSPAAYARSLDPKRA